MFRRARGDKEAFSCTAFMHISVIVPASSPGQKCGTCRCVEIHQGFHTFWVNGTADELLPSSSYYLPPAPPIPTPKVLLEVNVFAPLHSSVRTHAHHTPTHCYRFNFVAIFECIRHVRLQFCSYVVHLQKHAPVVLPTTDERGFWHTLGFFRPLSGLDPSPPSRDGRPITIFKRSSTASKPPQNQTYYDI